MNLLRRIEIHMRRSAITATRIGREAMGDPRFVLDLRNGRELRPATRARFIAWLERREQEFGR